MRVLLAALLMAAPCAAFAAGTEDTAPPTPTETSTQCVKAQVWDEKLKKCVDAQSGSLSDDDRFRAVRELAWAGQPENALIVLAAMTEGETGRVLAYLGFAHRKAGRLGQGLAYYDRALIANPDNILARSYYGQMLVEMAEFEAAGRQLEEIRARGGAGTWAEASLNHALLTGQTLSY